ncbi:hypothetical protein C8R43DRAFT_831349, partial [Mycena crocata]
FPSAVPLAVRSPTFNCWIDSKAGSNPTANWPTFWNDHHNLGWVGYIKVDGATWHWLGNPVQGNATRSAWISTQITPTRTIFTVDAGPMRLNVTFLSPVEPSDWTRQSFPFSYVYVDGKSTDGKPHSIQLYSDISAEWVTNSFTTPIKWSSAQTRNTAYHQVSATTPSTSFTDVAEDSSLTYYAVQGLPGLVSVVGSDQQLRAQFTEQGAGFNLVTDLPSQFGKVMNEDEKFPVLAHAIDLGQTDTISSVAWAVGLVRDPVVTFSGVARRSYFWSQHLMIGDGIDTFMSDFPAAVTRATALDQQILKDAGTVSQDYADLVSLATRQAMAGVEITLSMTEGGEFNLTDVEAFMKDVGNSQCSQRRVNPTETLFAALPALMYLNSSITGLLLEPLLRFQNSPAYPNPYAASDLGTPYPSAPGNSNSADSFGIENSGNMLIMALAHAHTSGDGLLISKYYTLLRKWADYLVANALIPAQQTSGDAHDPSLAQTHGNSTNLALKGIIAIQAMSEISKSLGNATDAQKYETSAQSLAQSWVGLATSSTGLRWTYGDDSSFGLVYNLFADKLLQLNVMPASVYTSESASLSNSSGNVPNFGFALSSDSDLNGRSDWTLLSAAAAPDAATRDLLISGVHRHAGSNASGTAGIFPMVYNVQTGTGPGVGEPRNGFASPAQGAMFAVLALKLAETDSISVANQPIVVPTGSSASDSATNSSSHKHTGAIVGGVLGAFAAILLVAGLAFFLRRRRQRRTNDDVQLKARP